MADFDNTNRGALFPNKRKTKDTHPNLTGRINIKGVDHWFSGWTKTAQSSGEKYISISIGDPCDPPGSTREKAPVDIPAGFDPSGDIPF